MGDGGVTVQGGTKSACSNGDMGVSTIVGAPIIRTMVFWGLYWGFPVLGNYHIPQSAIHELLVR